MKLKLLQTKPYIKKISKKKNKYLRFIFRVAKSPYFENTIIFIIMLNTLCLTINWY